MRLLWLSSALVLFVAGCSSPQTADSLDDPVAATPTDFSAHVMIIVGKDRQQRPEAHLRSGRFILLADGSLHYGDTIGQQGDVLPPFIRRLNRDDMARVWARARQLGLLDEDVVDASPTTRDTQAYGAELVYRMHFADGGQRWTITQIAEENRAIDEAMIDFVRMLARLAWADDRPPARPFVAPKRYDFGPDPYARYRKPAVP